MPNEKKTCKYMAGLCEKLDKCEHYQKFAKYRDHILSLSNDSLEKTIAIALSLCFVCAILVSIAAVALRPLQIENKAMDMKKNILDVAGLLQEGTNIHEAFAERIEAKLVDVATGDYVDGDVEAYDQRKAAKDPAQNVTLTKDQDLASIRARAKIAKVYLVKEGDVVKIMLLVGGG